MIRLQSLINTLEAASNFLSSLVCLAPTPYVTGTLHERNIHHCLSWVTIWKGCVTINALAIAQLLIY